MKKTAFIFLLSSFIILSAGASHREIDIKWKVGDSPDRKMNLEWFQGDSIGFNLTSKMNREPFVFATNDVLVWEVRGWIGDHTNLYAITTGSVVNAESGESRYELTVEQTANLPEGTCLGYVKAMQLDGTNLSERVVLGWQWINVEWSETSQDYETVGALAKPYTTPAEVAAIEAALSASLTAVSNQVSAVSGRVDQVVADVGTNQSAIGTIQSEMSAAPDWTAAYAWGNHALAGYLTSYTETDPLFAASTNATALRFQTLEGQTNLIQSALQAESDPIYSAWDKSTGIEISESQITNLQSYLTGYTETDPLWAASTNATEIRFQGLETVLENSSNVWNLAETAVQVDGSNLGEYPFYITGSGCGKTAWNVEISLIDSDGEGGTPRYSTSTNIYGGLLVQKHITTGGWSVPTWVASDEYPAATIDYYIESDSDTPPMTGWSPFEASGPPPDFSYTVPVSKPKFLSSIGGASTDSVATVSAKVDDLESGTEDFETLNLNGDPITSFDDIGLTYTNAVRLNSPVVLTNNAAWDGYTITGSLTASNHVYLTVGQTITSPLCTNGLASYEVIQSGSFRATVRAMTNGVDVIVPYYGNDAYLHIEMESTMGIPGTVTAATVEKVTLNGVENLDEAKLPKTVTRIDLIEHQPNPESATRRDYVEAEVLAAKDYANSQITAYSEDANKVVRCAMLRVGQDWVSEDVQGASDRYLLVDADYSGEGEIRGNGRFYFSKNGHPLLSGGASAVYYGAGVDITSVVQSNGYDIATVTITTNAVTAEPFLECSEDMVHAEWLNCTTLTSDWPTPTDGVYTLTVTTESKDKLFFKAGELTGNASDVRIEGDKLVLETKPIEMIDHGNGLTYHVVLSNGVWNITQQ